MALITAQDFILHAFRKCGQMRPGYLPPPELLAEGLDEWTLLFDSWQAERSMGFGTPQYQYAVNGPGSQENGNGYLLGPTAHAAGGPNDFQGPRPTIITRANCVLNSVGGVPVYIPLRPIGAEGWASLSIRQIPAINLTNLFWYNPTFPNGTFNIFPPMSGNSIELFTSPTLAAPASLTATYSAPSGYADAVVLSLAERVWPLVTHDLAVHKVSEVSVAGKAYAARQKVWKLNRPVATLGSDFRGGNRPAGFYDPNVSWTGEPY